LTAPRASGRTEHPKKQGLKRPGWFPMNSLLSEILQTGVCALIVIASAVLICALIRHGEREETEKISKMTLDERAAYQWEKLEDNQW
jgi:hypothetical protein